MLNEIKLKQWLEYNLYDETVVDYSLVYHWLFGWLDRYDKEVLIKDCHMDVPHSFETVLGECFHTAKCGDINVILQLLDEVRVKLDFDDGVIPVVILPCEWIEGVLSVEYINNARENFLYQMVYDHYCTKGDRSMPVHLTHDEYTTLYHMYKR